VAVLGAFRPGDKALPVAEIVRRTGLAKATAHRLVREMTELNLLERTPAGQVQLGSRLYELGHLVPRQRNLRDSALPLLGDLFEATRAAVNLAILDDVNVLYLVKLTSRHNPIVESRVGGTLPAYCTAVGKAMLAYLPREYAEKVARAPMPRLTPYTIDTPAKLYRELGKIHDAGLAFDREELSKGSVCVAAPILDAQGMAIAALSVTSWASSSTLQRFAGAVQATALTLSRQLSADQQLREDPAGR
jgi:DNA-binding IclR family transcriptional regulator